MATKGLRSVNGNPAAMPLSKGPYKQSEDMTYEGNLRKSPGRYYLEEFYLQRPAINGDIDQVYTTEVARAANKNFEVLGTNSTTALTTFSATEAGITMTTAGADNDQMILTPHLDATSDQTDSVTAWAGIQWGTENQVIWECAVRTPASVDDRLYWLGLKLTNTPAIATDADQVFFRYSTDDSDTNWEIVDSIGDSDTATDSGVAVAVSTLYYFRIEIDSDRKAHFYIDDVEIYVSDALTNDVDFIPYIGVQQLDSGTGDRQLTVCYQKISRILFE